MSEAISTALASRLPELEPVCPLRPLGAGFRSIVVETSGGAVFRIPRFAEVREGHAREARLLERLAPQLAVPVPEPRWRVEPCEGLPFGAIGYAKLPGRELALSDRPAARVAEQIAELLASLHRFPAGEALELGVPGPEAVARSWESLRDDVLPPLADLLTKRERARAWGWWERFLDDELLQSYEPALCHGDLWYENLLVTDDGERLVGVLDFEEAVVGDPAQDFATQLHMGAAFARSVRGARGPAFRHRVARYWELRPFSGLRHALHLDPDELDDALRKLRAGPILAR